MLITETKPIEEILTFLDRDNKIFILSCNGCPDACQTGGEEGMMKMKQELEGHGKSVIGEMLVDMVCNKTLDRVKLLRVMEKIEEADTVLVLSCGVGVQAVAKVMEKPVHPGLNTISVEGLHGLWLSEERCAACGECVLSLTGGICPVTGCAKSLLNGTCGGTTSDGKCEIGRGKDCGWYLIYERLKKINRLDNLRKLDRVRDYSRMIVPEKLRRSTFFDIEQEK